MPAAKNGQAIKDEILKLIAESIGTKTADMYRGFCDSQPPETAIASAEELLVEFVGRDRATEQVKVLRAKFNLGKVKAV
ncbi:MAG: hypothetical protein AAB776_02270 [Patescibacteria group bacterium]